MYDEKADQIRFNKLKLVEKAKRLRLDNFIVAAMGTSQGREYFYWLMEIAHIGRNPFTANALSTSFECGELNIGQQVQAHIMDVAPGLYLQMIQDKQEEILNVNRTDTNTDA